MEALAGDLGFGVDGAFRLPMNMNAAASAPQAAQPPILATAAPAIGDWKEWDDAAFDSMNFELDLGFDSFLMATADDFMEPLNSQPPAASVPAAVAATPVPTSPPMFSDFFDSSSCTSESESSVADEELARSPVAVVKAEPAKRSRKRKIPETQKKAVKPTTKAAKIAQQKAKAVAAISPEADRLYRRRYDILHEILEAWNTGGIEDMEEIADDVYDEEVTLVSPDYCEGLKGVQALMHHWTLLLDSFPDGIMEEYQIERDDPEGQKMNVSWVFSGTHIFPFFGVEPRHEKVTIRGKSFFTFKGEKISHMVLSWNYREALMKLMGVNNVTDRR